MNIPLFCEMLVDQNRFIGSDPVGHACSNQAVTVAPFRDGRFYLVCADCLSMDEERLSVSPLSGGDTEKQAMENANKRMADACKSIMERRVNEVCKHVLKDG